MYASGRSNVTTRNCNISGFDYGVRMDDASSSYAMDNAMHGNMFGIYLWASPENTISNNLAYSNSVEGILVLAGSSNCIVSGNAVYGHTNESYGTGILIQDYSNYTSVYNNTVYGNRVGISLENSTECNASFNDAHDNTYGIAVQHSEYGGDSSVRVFNNTARYNSFGILDLYSSGVELSWNTAENNSVAGIALREATGATVMGNNMSGSPANFVIIGSVVEHYIHNIYTNVSDPYDPLQNFVDGRRIVYANGISDAEAVGGGALGDGGMYICVNCRNVSFANFTGDYTLHNNSHGILFVNSSGCRAENINASGEIVGIAAMYSSGVSAANVSIEAPETRAEYGVETGGILLMSASNITLENIAVTGFNYTWGVSYVAAANTAARNLSISGGLFGVRLGDYSEGNNVSDSSITGSTVNVFAAGDAQPSRDNWVVDTVMNESSFVWDWYGQLPAGEAYDALAARNSSLALLNCTFNRSAVGVMPAPDDVANITLLWRVKFRAVDQDGFSLEGVNVTVNDTFGSILFSESTAGGYTSWHVANDSILMGAGNFTWNNYTVYAFKNPVSVESVTLDRSGVYVITLAYVNVSVLVYIDGDSVSSVIPHAGKPYNVTVVTNSTVPLTVRFIERNGIEPFSFPQYADANVSNIAVVEARTGPQNVSFTVFPTGAFPAYEDALGAYNQSIEVYQGDYVIFSKDYTVSDYSYWPTPSSSVSLPNRENVQYMQAQLATLQDRVLGRMVLGGGEVRSVTVYTNGTAEGMEFNVTSGKLVALNVTVEEPGGAPVEGAIVEVEEKNGFQLWAMSQYSSSNVANYLRASTLTDADGNAKLTFIPTGGVMGQESMIGDYNITLRVYNATGSLVFNATMANENRLAPTPEGGEKVFNSENVNYMNTQLSILLDRLLGWLIK